MPVPPAQPNLTAANNWIVWVPGLPIRIQYMGDDTSSAKEIYALKVVTLRNKLVMKWRRGSQPTWYEPFDSYVTGDSVNLEIRDLILRPPIERE